MDSQNKRTGKTEIQQNEENEVEMEFSTLNPHQLRTSIIDFKLHLLHTQNTQSKT